MGYGDERARKICGRIQADIEGGSSQRHGAASDNPMSFPPKQEQQEKKPEEESAGITLSKQKAEVVVSALVNSKQAVGSQDPELAQQLDEAIAVFGEVANIEP